MSLKVAFLNENARAPTRGSVHAAGYDLYAAEEKTIPANGRGLVDLGLSMSIPEGTYARIAPRSGLAVKNGLSTGAGVIDYDYRGPVKVMLFNHSTEDFNVTIGDRVAQMILERIVTPRSRLSRPTIWSPPSEELAGLVPPESTTRRSVSWTRLRLRSEWHNQKCGTLTNPAL